MADPAVVNTSKGVGTGTTVATDTTISVTAGNGLVVFVSSAAQGTQTITGVASVGNATGWTALTAIDDGNGNYVQGWYKPNASTEAAATFTATWSATIGNSQITAFELSGVDTTAAMLAAQNTGTATSLSTVTSGNLSPPRAAVICAGYVTTNDRSWTPDNSATEVLDQFVQYGGAGGGGSHHRAVAAGTYTAGATASSGFGFATIAAAAFVGPPPPPETYATAWLVA